MSFSARARDVRTLVLATLIATVALVAGPATAGAAVSYYNCIDKPSGQWCDGKANGSFDGLNSWDYNEGWNPGSGSFTVCQRVYRPATGGVLTGSSCAANFTAYWYGDVMCSCYEAHVMQTSGSAKSINGFADSDF